MTDSPNTPAPVSDPVEEVKMADRVPGDEQFDDTHDVYTRGESEEVKGYAETRDSVDVGIDNAAWRANFKRTYDEYQHESLRDLRRNDRHENYGFREMSQYDSARQNIANQALQNAVETANMVAKNNLESSNMVAKQAIRHADLSISEQWSRMETSDVYEGLVENEGLRTSGLDDASLKAIAAAVAVAVVQAMSTQAPAPRAQTPVA